MADPREVVVEVVGWDGIDPLPELPIFHSTAEDSFGGSLYIFGEPAIFWLEGWRAFMRFHRGDDEAPTQEARCWQDSGASWSDLRRGLGSDDLVRVRRGASVRVAGNPRRVAQPRGGSEGGVRSGNGELAPNCLPGAG